MFAESDILKFVKTGLFWYGLPSKTYDLSVEDLYGTMSSKERLTIIFTVSRTCEKFKPLLD